MSMLAAILAALALLAPPARTAASTDTLVVCDDIQDPLSLNPYLVFSEKTHTLLQQILEGLVRFDTQGRIEPALARSWYRVNDTTMRFHLRKRVMFHNGESFDAKSVKFSLEKYVAPETHFLGAGFVETISSVNVVNDYTVDVITRRPDGLLLNRLAAWVHIVPPRYYLSVGDAGFSTHPVGTGPFVFQGWEKGRRIVLSANPNYWMEGYPKMEQLVFKFIPWQQQVTHLIAGSVDILTELPGTQTIEVVRSTTAKVVKKETFYTVVIPFNVTRGPLADKRVRLALNYAINREDLIRYDVLGNGRIIASMTMPGEEGHNPDLKPYPYDPKKAQRLLKEAGYGGRLNLRMLVKEQGTRTAALIQKQLEAIGVHFSTRTTTDAQIIKDIASQDWDLFIGGCPDPMVHSYFIQSVTLYSKSPYAIGRYAEFDQRLEEMSVTLDAYGRASKARELDRLVYTQALALFTYQRIKTYGVNKQTSFTPSITGMSYFFSVEKHEAKSRLGQQTY